jgi:hypothetical protein
MNTTLYAIPAKRRMVGHRSEHQKITKVNTKLLRTKKKGHSNFVTNNQRIKMKSKLKSIKKPDY